MCVTQCRNRERRRPEDPLKTHSWDAKPRLMVPLAWLNRREIIGSGRTDLWLRWIEQQFPNSSIDFKNGSIQTPFVSSRPMFMLVSDTSFPVNHFSELNKFRCEHPKNGEIFWTILFRAHWCCSSPPRFLPLTATNGTGANCLTQ
jgi:hypothetical protein